MIEFFIGDVSLSSKQVMARVEDIMARVGTSKQTTISVYPKYIESAALAIGDSCNVTLCAICLSSLHSYLEVTALECSMAVENGADQVEIAIDQSLESGEAEEYLRISAEEVEDVADFAILVDSSSSDVERCVAEGLKVATDLGVTTLSFGLGREDRQQIAQVAQMVANHNTATGGAVVLRLVVDFDLNRIDRELESFIAQCRLEQLVESKTLKLRELI